MKFDPLNWSAYDGKKVPSLGFVHVRASQPVVVYVEAEGVEAIAGIGHEVEVRCAPDALFRVEAPKGVAVFYERKMRSGFEPSDRALVNVDRKPQESGAVLEVRKALREFEYQKRIGLRELAAAAARAKPEQAEPAPESKPSEKPADEAGK